MSSYSSIYVDYSNIIGDEVIEFNECKILQEKPTEQSVKLIYIYINLFLIIIDIAISIIMRNRCIYILPLTNNPHGI